MMSCFLFTLVATTEIYTLSLHDALPIYVAGRTASNRSGASAIFDRDRRACRHAPSRCTVLVGERAETRREGRSEEHTSELQSHSDLVCRLLLEKKKQAVINNNTQHSELV